MPIFEWNQEKNLRLQINRDVRFEEVVSAFNENRVLDTIDHTNQKKYPGQRIFIVKIREYTCAIPFVEKGDVYFLKTIYRSRKAAKRYLKKGK